MPDLSPRENYLAAVRFADPEYVPLACEGVWYGFQFEGNFRLADWTDHWGVGWQVGIEGTVPFPRRPALPSLDGLADFVFPDPGELVFTETMREQLAAVDRGRQLVVGHLTYLLFERAWAIMGMESFLTQLLTHPDQMHVFLHGLADYARRVFRRYLDLGVDAIGFSEDLGTQRALTMSPRLFREFLLPQYAYCFEEVLAAGKMVLFHSCGCLQEVAADLAALGVTELNPVQARANDLARLKADTCGRMALNGGIDTALLAGGAPAAVRAEVIRVMEVLKPGGGYICGPDQGIPGIPPENMQTLWDTAREVGRY